MQKKSYDYFGDSWQPMSEKERQLNHEFVNYCQQGDLEKVQEYLQKDEVYIDFNTEKPFTGACENGHLNVVKYLLEISNSDKSQINPRTSISYTYHIACRLGYLEILKELLKYNDKKYNKKLRYMDYEQPWSCTDGLITASKYGQLDTIKFLLDWDQKKFCDIKGIYWKNSLNDPNKSISTGKIDNGIFLEACHCGQLEIVQYIIEKTKYVPMMALFHKFRDTANKFMKKDHISYKTLIHGLWLAAKSDNLEVLKYLVIDAKIKFKMKDFNFITRDKSLLEKIISIKNKNDFTYKLEEKLKEKPVNKKIKKI